MEPLGTLLFAILATLAIGAGIIVVISVGIVGVVYLVFRLFLWLLERGGRKEATGLDEPKSENEAGEENAIDNSPDSLFRNLMKQREALEKVEYRLTKLESEDQKLEEVEQKIQRFEREFEALGIALESRSREFEESGRSVHGQKRARLLGVIQDFEELLNSLMPLGAVLSEDARSGFKERVDELFKHQLDQARACLESSRENKPAKTKRSGSKLARLVELSARRIAADQKPLDGHLRQLSQIDQRAVVITLVDEAMGDTGCDIRKRDRYIGELLGVVGVNILNPRRGVQVHSAEHNMVGEERFPGLSRGAVVSVKRPGFRDRGGKLIRKADVVMAR